MKQFLLITLLAATTTLSTNSIAQAQNPRVNVQLFRPASHYDDLWTVMNTNIGEHMRWSAGLMVHYGKNPLVFVDTTGGADKRHEVIRDQFTTDLTGSLSLFERVSFGIGVPIHLVNAGAGAGSLGLTEPSSPAFGDIRLSAKVGIITRKDVDTDGFGFAGELSASLPTGGKDSFVADNGTLTPQLVGDYKSGPVLIALQLGYLVRLQHQTLAFGDEIGNELVWKVGGRFDVVPGKLRAIGELYGGSSDYSSANHTYIEGMIGGDLLLPEMDMAVTVGGGSGFAKGYGNTKFRIFAGVKYSPAVIVDQDEDGILDEFDSCPLVAEDLDGFEDKDGCPEADNDIDHILDPSDKCPNDPEDKDGFQDEDGCPDVDNDGDGILDAADKCADVAEDKDGFEDEDGCPETDNDGDGILDVDDKCINEPEVMNGFEDEDGCPDETLAKVVDGAIKIADKIYFATGKAKIKDESIAVMKAVSGILKANPGIKHVNIEGHTDDRGKKKSNLKLSQARAESVKAWLVADGVDEARLSATGFGEDKPQIEGRTKEARQANRRVEFLIQDQ